MRNTQCYEDYVYQPSMWSRAEKTYGIHWSIWLFAGPSGCILTSSKQCFTAKKKYMKVPFYQTLSDFWKRKAFLGGSQASSIFPSSKSNMRMKMVEWYWQGKTYVYTRRKTCPSATLTEINLTYTGLGLNPGLRGEKEVTIYKNSVRTSQRTQYVSIRKTNRWNLDGVKEIAVHCGSQTKHASKMHG